MSVAATIPTKSKETDIQLAGKVATSTMSMPRNGVFMLKPEHSSDVLDIIPMQKIYEEVTTVAVPYWASSCTKFAFSFIDFVYQILRSYGERQPVGAGGELFDVEYVLQQIQDVLHTSSGSTEGRVGDPPPSMTQGMKSMVVLELLPMCVDGTTPNQLLALSELVLTYSTKIASPCTRDPLAIGFFPKFVAHLNHSCNPNCLLVVRRIESGFVEGKRVDQYEARLYALRDISGEEELTIAYNEVVPSILDPELRRMCLQTEYGFVCRCARCVLETETENIRTQLEKSIQEEERRNANLVHLKKTYVSLLALQSEIRLKRSSIHGKQMRELLERQCKLAIQMLRDSLGSRSNGLCFYEWSPHINAITHSLFVWGEFIRAAMSLPFASLLSLSEGELDIRGREKLFRYAVHNRISLPLALWVSLFLLCCYHRPELFPLNNINSGGIPTSPTNHNEGEDWESAEEDPMELAPVAKRNAMATTAVGLDPIPEEATLMKTRHSSVLYLWLQCMRRQFKLCTERSIHTLLALIKTTVHAHAAYSLDPNELYWKAFARLCAEEVFNQKGRLVWLDACSSSMF